MEPEIKIEVLIDTVVLQYIMMVDVMVTLPVILIP
jgi:hypothetical protein